MFVDETLSLQEDLPVGIQRNTSTSVQTIRTSISKIPDLQTPFRECWSSARTLWKCYIWTRNCVPGPIKTNTIARDCWLQSLECSNISEGRLFSVTNFVSLNHSIIVIFLTYYSLPSTPLLKYVKKQKMLLVLLLIASTQFDKEEVTIILLQIVLFLLVSAIGQVVTSSSVAS
jgi:hypothetical protein